MGSSTEMQHMASVMSSSLGLRPEAKMESARKFASKECCSGSRQLSPKLQKLAAACPPVKWDSHKNVMRMGSYGSVSF